MGGIFRGLSGEEELWKIIWIYGAFLVFLGFVGSVILRIVVGVDLDRPTPSQEDTLNLLKIIYGIWFYIAAWRCAFNAHSHAWGYIVRLVLIVYTIFCFYVYYQLQWVLDPFAFLNKAIDFARTWSKTK